MIDYSKRDAEAIDAFLKASRKVCEAEVIQRREGHQVILRCKAPAGHPEDAHDFVQVQYSLKDPRSYTKGDR